MRYDVLIEPDAEVGIGAIDVIRQLRLECRWHEKSCDTVELGFRRIQAERLDVGEFLFDLTTIFVGAEFVDKDLDARLVDIVAAAVAIVDAQAGLDITEQIVRRHKIANFRRDHRRPPHAAADEHAATKYPVTLDQLDADIVQPHRSAVLGACDHRDLELARQIAEFGVKSAPLAKKFSPDARIGDFIGGGSGILVRGDVADAVPARLNCMHFDRRKLGEQVGTVLELDPVVLDILARCEMAVATVIFARDMPEHPHLTAVQRAIGNRHAQHVGMELEV